MSSQDAGTGQAGDQVVSADEAARARARLASWLSAEDPEDPVTADELLDWPVTREDEFLVLVPPGYANQVYLLADHGISWYAPSRQSFEDALAVARAQR
ncbi:MAG TPA: hypothetical protein VGL05_21890 [Kribbella sp.]